MTRVSVCLATYNGGEHLMDQLASILQQIAADDEVVAVDDGSSDSTVNLLHDCGDPRLRVVQLHTNGGHIAAFERAISEARGSLIVLSDQDDLWPPGRLDVMVNALAHADLVAGNYCSFGDTSGLPEHPLSGELDRHPLRNVVGLALGRRPYYGSCMAFRESLLDVALPFPSHVRAHDHWLAIAANLAGTVRHLDDVVTLRRTHAHNMSQGDRPLGAIIGTRLVQLAHIASALARRCTTRSSRP